MTDSPITPTVGRVVLVCLPGVKPNIHPGIVTQAHGQNTINVTVFPNGGLPSPYTSVPYSEVEDEMGWHWMDYQLKVAAERDPVSGEPAAT